MEPERPIEKLLGECAEKRRGAAGAPLELHPATRRLLQAEITRKFGGNQRGVAARDKFLARLWPNLAWGLTMLAALGICAKLMLPSANMGTNSMTLAKAESRQNIAPVMQPAPAPATVSAGAPLAEESRARAPLRQSEPKEAPAELAYKTTGAELALGANKSEAARETIAPAALPPSATNWASSVAQRQVGGQSYEVAQRFIRQPSVSAARAAADAVSADDGVLASFDLQQSGRQLRIVDSDGSVYEGSIEPASGVGGGGTNAQPAGFDMLSARPAVTSDSEKIAKDGFGGESTGRGYYFRVTGTNRSMNANVVFTGNLAPSANGAVVSGKATLPNALLLRDARISGQATVGEKPATEIKAVPVTP